MFIGRLRRCSATCGTFGIARCRSGAVAVVTAMVLPVLLGFTSLGVEVGHWYLSQRVMQGAADAAAISAAAQYIVDSNAGNGSSTTYQTVGVSYASYNGFTIPTSNVCLVTSSGNNCSSVLSLDSRAIVCASPPCVVVEVTQNTASWLTTKASLEPGSGTIVKAIPTPILKARAIVTAKSQTQTTTTAGTDCILALANDPGAITVHGGTNADLTASCGVAIDGGLDQNASGTANGGITFNGAKSKVNIQALVVAAKTALCPDAGVHCQQFGSSAALTNVTTNTATPDPYASQVAALFKTAPPLGVQTVAITKAGSGYTNGSCTFTVTGGTYYGTPSSPTIFTATISGGKVTAIGSVTDPGAYTTLPTSPVSATDTCGGSGATFTLTEGCYNWSGSQSTLIANRKYCTINVTGSINFPTGNYWIAGGCFCVSGNGNVTSDVAGVTFFLTDGEGTQSTTYATVSISGTPTLGLCAPGTSCGKTCTNTAGPASCMLFVQNPAAPASTGLSTPSNTTNSFNGTASSTLSGLVYLSQQTYQNTGTSKIGGCVGVIAKYFDIGGTPSFSDGCLPGNGIGGTTTTTTTLTTPYLYQ